VNNVDVDVVLAEFSALRAEILSCQQAQTGVFVGGMTATAAVGAIAFSKGSRLQILLVLPFVLSGLGLLYLDYSRRPAAIGKYIRTELWLILELHPACRQLPSWERYLDKKRQQLSRRDRLLGALPFVLVFLVPSVLALVVGAYKLIHSSWGEAYWLLWVACLVVVLMLLALLARRRWHPAAWH
jgi:hypothetical protein